MPGVLGKVVPRVLHRGPGQDRLQRGKQTRKYKPAMPKKISFPTVSGAIGVILRGPREQRTHQFGGRLREVVAPVAAESLLQGLSEPLRQTLGAPFRQVPRARPSRARREAGEAAS